jgi:large subunit ribosomal protein L3
MQGLIGTKRGMTQVFDGDGRRVAVTAIEVGPCVVVQRKTRERDGYDAAQLGFGEQKPRRLSKALRVRYEKAGTSSKRVLREFAVDAGEDVKVGDTVGASMFTGVNYVDVTGMSKGRGFQGVVKRHRMAGGPMTHGGHSKRRPGAIGQRELPGHVIKGLRMPGHMGHVRVTQQNLKVVQVRPDENLILIHGSIPGPNGCVVCVSKALKKAGQQG